jgi:hypothetical protein
MPAPVVPVAPEPAAPTPAEIDPFADGQGDPFAGDSAAPAAQAGEPDWDDPSALGIEQLPSGPIVPGEGELSDAAVDDASIESILNDD